LNGQNLSPKVTSLTPLSALLNGAGLDVTGGLRITNGTATVNVDFTGCATVQDLLNRINSSGVGALARINSAQNGIEIVNPVQGTNMSVAENGGMLATTLGVRSFSPTTKLADLNGGQGVHTATGADIQITAKDGSTFQVDLSGLVTVQDVMNAITTASGGKVIASFATTGNGIILTDTSGGAGSLTVTQLNFSTAAKDLGILDTTTGTTLTGTDVNPVMSSGIFGALSKLQIALQSSDQSAITAAASDLQNQLDQVVRVRGATGARIQEMASRQSRMEDQNTATQSLLSTLEDTDYTQAITQFQLLQNTLQASLMTTAKTLNLSLMDFLS
jgi:flagellin-like hook-associated protein FlgL